MSLTLPPPVFTASYKNGAFYAVYPNGQRGKRIEGDKIPVLNQVIHLVPETGEVIIESPGCGMASSHRLTPTTALWFGDGINYHLKLEDLFPQAAETPLPHQRH